MGRHEVLPAPLAAKIKTTLAVQSWRLNNLYHVEDKKGRIVPFRLWGSQRRLFETMWYMNVILKARQLGFSTFIAILFLDVCLFNSNTRCGIVDATIDDAKKKLRKILLAYKHLPKWLQDARPIVSANAFSIEWANGSGIEVGTSHRGGTLQYLHISELGKIAAKFPEKAREIRTGALNTIQAGQMCFVESTAEGQDGDFYSMCQEAEAKHRVKARLTPLDFKFHFFPWWQATEYRLDEHVDEPESLVRYFDKLTTEHGIKLTRQQRAWYVKKAESQRDDMKREYPSTPAEAFEASVEGAIFGPQLAIAEESGRVGAFKAVPGIPVHTFWDIGRNDYTSIWFVQVLMGPKLRVVGFYQNCLTGMPHYAEYCLGTEAARKAFKDFSSKDECKGVFADRGWTRGRDFFPHDAKVTEWGSDRSRIEQLKSVGFNAKLATEMGLHDGINAARATIGFCEFDQAGCAEGLKVLKSYRWEWDDLRGVWKSGSPRHDTASHGSDAFRYLGTSWREVVPSVPVANVAPSIPILKTSDEGIVELNMSFDEFMRAKERAASDGI